MGGEWGKWIRRMERRLHLRAGNVYYTGKKRVESLYDFQMICHLHYVTECLQTVT